MKVYYIKNDKKQTYGIQLITETGEKVTLESHAENLDGLWQNSRQVIGTCDFDVCCSETTARKRLLQQAFFVNADSVNWLGYKLVPLPLN